MCFLLTGVLLFLSSVGEGEEKDTTWTRASPWDSPPASASPWLWAHTAWHIQGGLWMPTQNLPMWGQPCRTDVLLLCHAKLHGKRYTWSYSSDSILREKTHFGWGQLACELLSQTKHVVESIVSLTLFPFQRGLGLSVSLASVMIADNWELPF